MVTLDRTHDAARRSWVVSANGHRDFPLQNLPLGVFRRVERGPAESFRWRRGGSERVRAKLAAAKLVTHSALFTELAAIISASKHPPFEFVVVDEAQDLAVGHLKLLAAIGGKRPSALFFAGDLGQRIFQQPFSWSALGVDVRGRARNLTVNYRTSHQIRMQADRLLGQVEEDVDGNTEDRDKTVSVFNGPPPTVRVFKNAAEETSAVAGWIGECIAKGVAPHEIGVFVRSDGQMERARAAATAASVPFRSLDDRVDTVSGQLSVATMHHAKGLEFRAVAVMACDDEVIPSQERIESISDEAVTSPRFTEPSAISCTWRARGRATSYSSRVSPQGRNSWRISYRRRRASSSSARSR